MMNKLKSIFEDARNDFIKCNAISKLASGDLTIPEYRSVLRQIFHHTRENPQLQALATVYFRGRQRDMVRPFLAHASSEIGHDQLALNDFVSLGGDPKHVEYENPHPATSALLAYGFYQIYNLNPLGYLGYLFFLEFNGTANGEPFMDSLRNIGVPDSAMTFLRDHAEIDIGHNKLMEKYVSHMIHSQEDYDAIAYAMKTTGYLYGIMLDAAVANADNSVHFGWNWEELNADDASPYATEEDVAAFK
ncbi:MAG: hypothetical protein HKN14_11995 [Marinicaulis sp.]|nr:hypothetical protein [Marinicaulis sp.]NNL90215.1 hypothetical protein [Marinicaulis sp.]